ncbi:MAG: hypothetical protein IKL68_04735 [Clostridia bacterium]|nr:hypothetical protein [Clostridia bacterium]
MDTTRSARIKPTTICIILNFLRSAITKRIARRTATGMSANPNSLLRERRTIAAIETRIRVPKTISRTGNL